MQRTANENAACLIPRICKRFDEPTIERIANNDSGLILHRKLKGGNDMIGERSSKIVLVFRSSSLFCTAMEPIASTIYIALARLQQILKESKKATKSIT